MSSSTSAVSGAAPSNTGRPVAASVPGQDRDIAIVGMACRFPGANNYDEFWANLVSGTGNVGEVPGERWDWSKYYGDPASGNKTNSKWGGYLDNVDRFDASFFGISPREAVCMDPQQRIILELAWQCIEDAGHKPRALAGTDVGVFVATSSMEYKTLRERFGPSLEGHHATGLAMSAIANRISYFFDFHGPSIALDTACSGSLVAMQAGISAIRNGECSAALVGAISVMATPDTYMAFGKVGMLSSTGACHTFDEQADGYVRGEGGGLVYLKPLSAALADGDRILGVVKGISTNHGGRARSLTAPNVRMQSKAIATALRQAGISPATVNYVETHGTGTPLGDPIEIHGLVRAFSQSAADGEQLGKGYCALGALKASIGHLESAAGIAGIIKVLLAMRFKTIPQNLNFTRLNPRISLDDTPFYIADRLTEWKNLVGGDGAEIPLRAGVSSFGFGGVNGHVIIEQAPAAEQAAAHHAAQLQLLALSAASEQSLLALMARHVDLLAQPGCDFAALCRQANTTRSFHAFRVTRSAASAPEMAAALAADISARREAKGPAQGGAARHAAPVVGFMFTGQGAQHVGMGRDLFEQHPVFRAAFEACDRLLAPLLGLSIIEACRTGADGDLHRTRLTQPALFAFEYALAQMWKAHGVVPAAVIGHSVGEIAAACVAGVLRLEDAAALVAARGRLMDAVPADGAMANIHAGEEQVRAWMALLGNAVDIAAVNAPQLTVVSGPVSEVERILAHAAQCGVEGARLHVAQAFHSRLMEPVLAPFMEAVAALPMNEPVIPFFSNVTGALAAPGQLAPDYWVEHIRKPVLFGTGVEQMRLSGVDLFLEIGPASVLTGIGRRCCAGEARWVPSMQREGSAYQHVLAALGELFRLGVEVDFAPLYGGRPQAFVQLPTYPFSGNSYWFRDDGAERQDRGVIDLLLPPGASLLGSRVQLAGSPDHVYMSAYPNEATDYLAAHRVRGEAVMPAAGYVEMAFAAWRQSAPRPTGGDAPGIDGLRLHTMLRLQPGVALQTILKAPQPGSNERAFEVWFARQPGPGDAAGQPDGLALAWHLAASGRVGPQGAALPPAAAPMDAATVRTVDTEAMYADMAARGLEYGPAFRALRSLAVAGEVAQGLVVLHPSVRREDGALVHATLVDAVFQSAYPLLARHVAAARTYVPVALDGMVVGRPLPDRFTVQARMAPATAGAATLRCEFALFDEEGGAIGAVGALTLHQMAEPADGAAPARGDGWLYQSAWTCREEAAPAPGASARGETIVVYGAASRALAERTAAGIEGEVVHIDFDARAPFDPAAPGNYHAFDPGAPAALADLLGRYRKVDAVYFFGGFTLPGEGTQLGEREAVRAAQEQGTFALFHLVKCLLAQGELRPLQLKVIGNFNQAVMPGQAVLPWGAGTAALASVFCRENPAVELANIDLDLERDDLGDAGRMAAAAARILAEPCVAGGRICAYRGGARYVREFEPAAGADAGSAGFKTGGVYLILGGAGGIGLHLARYLVERYAAKVVLVGRSAPGPERLAEIAAIGQAQGVVLYAQADGTDIAAMSAVVATAKARFGRIDGAVHSAIVLRDALLANMDAAAFSEAMQPKVDATLVLAEALRGESLDFLMFFSSAVSLWPTPGQANYVAGCAFQDAYAAHLRQRCAFPVKVINWGRWGGVGVATSEKYSQHFDAQGVYPIDPAEGLAAIETILHARAEQVLALKAEPSRLAALGVRAEFLGAAGAAPALSEGLAGGGAARLSPADIEALACAGDQGALQSGLYAYLVDELSVVLRVAPGAFDPAQGDLRQSYLSELGMDSLTALDLRTRLRKHLQVDIPIEFLLGGARIQAVFDSIYEQVLVRRLMQGAQGGAAGQNEDDGADADMETMVI